MYNSNGFNVCPHCGKPNSLNARFCARCGKQLTVPDEVTVCPKCRKTNSPLASFCGHCGAPLKEGIPTKICPRCGKSVSLSDNICSCGYNFGNAYLEVENSAKRGNHSGGRAIAIFGLLLVLLFAYIIFVPTCVLRPNVISEWDNGIFAYENSENYEYKYGIGVIKLAFDCLTDGGFDSLVDMLGIGGMAIVAMCLAVAISLVVRFATYLVRCFTAKRSKHMNIALPILAILTTLWTIIWAVCKYLVSADSVEWLLSVRDVFVPKVETGYILFAIPVYFWFFYIYTACTKVKVLREQMMWRN